MTTLKVEQQEDLVVVRFAERQLTDDEQILRISNKLNEVLESASAGMRLLLDLQGVEIVASMLLGDLVALNKKAARKGVILQLRGLSSDVARVMKTCKLDGLFRILEDPPCD